MDRLFRQKIRPLRFKPASRNLLRVLDQPASRVGKSEPLSKDRGEKSTEFEFNKVYEKYGWFCCGFCSAATTNIKQFAEHKNSARHKLKVSLSTIPELTDCLCGKIFKTNNQVHKVRNRELLK